MSFSNLKIGGRQAIGSAFLMIIMVIMALIGVVKLNIMTERLAVFSDKLVPNITTLYNIVDNYRNSAVTLRNSMLTEDLVLTKQEVDKYKTSQKTLKENLEKYDKMELEPEARDIFNRIKKILDQIDPLRDKALNLASENHNKEASDILFNEIAPIQGPLFKDIDTLLKLNNDKLNKETAGDLETAKGGVWLLLVFGGSGVVLGIISAFFISRSIVGPIKKAVRGLSDASDQVASASSQVASSSQQLAEGASEQAAAIEETSSSLEEMSSMTKQNSNNAAQANQLMLETKTVVEEANHSMHDLNGSMAQISKAGEETQKIIKTIDEIAFQTNLLALNAAVEAARAGEAGAGFAVVADEVRNLALRAAEAAKNTTELIEGTVKRVKEGSSIVERTNDAFSRVATRVARVSELVGEISAASQEQSQGIEQVNRAVSDMDKVTQQNSAGAEESASASEELSSQALQMQDFVVDLVKLVGGDSREPLQRPKKAGLKRPERKNFVTTAAPTKKYTGKPKALHNRNEKENDPRKMIPFDGEEFGDF